MEPSEHNNTALRLVELSTSDFEISDDQPDIIGWLIVDSYGDEVGEVEDVIFDIETKKVRYIVSSIDLDEDGDERWVLIPIGVVSFDEAEDEVVIPEEDVVFLNTLPVYEPGTVISPAEELAIRYAFLGKDGLTAENTEPYAAHPEDFYTHKHFNDDKFRRGNTPSV
jgi:sporulation protein YlmC with PRC-barrel domain